MYGCLCVRGFVFICACAFSSSWDHTSLSPFLFHSLVQSLYPSPSLLLPLKRTRTLSQVSFFPFSCTRLRQERAKDKTRAALSSSHEAERPDVGVLKKAAQLQLEQDMKKWPVSKKAEEEEVQRRIKEKRAADLHEERYRSDKIYRLRHNKMQKMKSTVMVAGVRSSRALLICIRSLLSFGRSLLTNTHPQALRVWLRRLRG